MDTDGAIHAGEADACAEDGDGANPGPPRPPALIALAVSDEQQLVACVVEGSDEVCLVRVTASDSGVHMVLEGRHCIGSTPVMLPTRIAFDSKRRLWAVGGPCTTGAVSFHTGICSISGATHYQLFLFS